MAVETFISEREILDYVMSPASASPAAMDLRYIIVNVVVARRHGKEPPQHYRAQLPALYAALRREMRR